ncbi:erythroblast NAD(P)(+)--arginine ADP-ribosyltransferase-like [Ambystoma mexicanum]|uniref:erythroblast NAD(P)(+)--arginine ADP-ribosyltransferase-like n=1 Tax=Ambystoma mexicanum TaxID=8296 RepID=UPI0037E7EA4E
MPTCFPTKVPRPFMSNPAVRSGGPNRTTFKVVKMWPSTLIRLLFVTVILAAIPQTACHQLYKRDIFLLEPTIDLRLSAFDEQYEGCAEAMEAALPALNRTEYAKNKYFARGWEAARTKWENRNHTTVLSSGFRDEHAIAILAYTSHGELYKAFNKAVREGGLSPEHYQKNFKFKTLHFLLTRALQLLEAQEETPRCFKAYRGYRDIRYKTKKGKLVRFGQFVSSSLSQRNGLRFGQHTVFEIETCYGVNIKNFSSYPETKELLIPPFEKFMVMNFTRTPKQNLVHLHSVDKLSLYNCEYLKEKKCKTWKCLFKSDATTRSSWSVLPALAALWMLFLMGPCFPWSN